MATEVRAGEAGVLRAALGVVLALEGIDARVRLFLWSGGVTDVTLPVLGTQRVAGGMQVVVMFLSDRPESGVVLGPLDGNLSWRRTAPPAWEDRIQPTIAAVIEGAQRGQGAVTHKAGFFAFAEDAGALLACGCVALSDGRVFLLPADATAPAFVFDPLTLALHRVPWSGQAGGSCAGGVLLLDGRVLLTPAPAAQPGQAYLYDPALDRLDPAGAAEATGTWGAVLLTDGRALLVPHTAAHPQLYDPTSNSLTVSQAACTGCAGGVLLPDGQVLLVPFNGGVVNIYDPATDAVQPIVSGLADAGAYAGGVLLADGRVLLVPFGMGAPLVVVEPGTGSLTVCEAPDFPGGWRSGTLLPDGRAVLFPNQYSLDLAAVYAPDSNTVSTIEELGALGLYGVGQDFTGGCALPDGRVLFAPGSLRDLVLWDPGCGVGLGRDVVLSGWWNKG